MKRATIISVLVAAAIAGTAVTATAKQDGEGRKGPRHLPIAFSELDTNGDGQLTLDELQAQRDARFAEADTNGDGLLSAEEITAQAEQRKADRVTRMIERFDENGDGQLSAEEMPKPRRGGDDMAERMIERLDSNDDGTISEEEFAKLKMKRKGKHGHRND